MSNDTDISEDENITEEYTSIPEDEVRTLYKDEEWLRTQIVDKDRTLSNIAEQCGCDKGNISYYKRKFDIKKPWKNEETLWSMYVIDGMEQGEIADHFGVERGTIGYWLEKFELSDVDPLGSGPSVWYNGDYDCAYQDPNILKGMYHGRSFSTYLMGVLLNTSDVTVGNWLKEYDIPRRNDSDAQRNANGTLNSVNFYTNVCGREKWVDGYKNKNYPVSAQRLLAVAEYGFDAVDDMVVHHKNKIPWDNRPDNIELMTREDHSAHHSREDELWKNMLAARGVSV